MSQSDELLQKWNSEPNPLRSNWDGRIILDCEDATASAYLWDSHNSSEGWLSFDGELMEIKR